MFIDTLSPEPEPHRRAKKSLSNVAASPNYDLAILCLVAKPSADRCVSQFADINFKNHLKSLWRLSSNALPEFLSQCFLDTLSPQPEPRRRAEKNLSDAADSPNYGLAVLRLVAEPSVDEQIRQCAAVNFKNHLKTRWVPSSASPIPDAEKEQIKTLIVPLMLSATPKIQAQLSEALAVIGNHDFPKLWPALLPELRSSLETAINANDFASVNGILATVNSLFKKFRYQFKSDPILLDLKYCLDNFAAPLLATVESISVKINAAAGNAATLRQLIEAQRLCCRVFYSLNFLDLPEFFEDTADKWMNEFKNYLTVRYPVVEDSGADGLSLVDELRAAVCENISHYMEKEEELFQKYLSGFVEAVWSLLVVASASPSRERLTVTAIKFLTIVSTSVHHALFAGDDILQQITQSIVIPNVMLRDEDEELFEMNYVEFIRRDMEGSDLDTRRRIACELLKGIAGNYKEKITERVSSQIHNCLALFAENPAANWKYKDCAIYLVVSLATKKAAGASISTDLVDVESFFRSVIVPELQGQDVNAFPMLKAGALKFFTMFRVLIPKPVSMALLGDVVRFLSSDANVVHSYAASCIEKLLLVKDNGVQARYTSMDIGPILPMLMTNLFGALEKPESEENQYIMRCIMRVLQIADISPEVASPCVTGLTSVLNRVCENPKNPVFNHCLFEAVATLVRRACEKNPSLVPAFETCLLPSLQMILAKEVTEFFPYAFQLLAQLVDLNKPPVPAHYMQIFDILLRPDLWKKSANVPALVRLLQSFLQQAPNELNREGRLSHVLGIFNKLVSSPSTEEQGFYILNPVIENLGYDVLAEYMNHIWASLFTRLQNSKTPRLVRCLIIFMSLFLVKHGLQTLMDSINSVQANLFHVILGQFWIPTLKTITGYTEVKLSAVASTKLLCESPSLLDPAAEELWGKLLDSIVALLSQPEEERVEDEPEVPDFAEATGYQATFVRLHNAGKKEEDPLKEIKDPKHFSVALLANTSSQFRGRFPPIITRYLSPANQAALLQLCNSYNLSIDIYNPTCGGSPVESSRVESVEPAKGWRVQSWWFIRRLGFHRVLKLGAMEDFPNS
ncbi:Armadillo-like helical [Cynara cardunculus var. scolymus]|uniref:Armadillo-like helical n=1 Tax=Cynara cardunculus var. scolymus TaxID=59895 RepID=A0A103XE11_CYNCS|nr:Armadillo-like helical [Cynara cardunculus var. scolymus]